MSIDLVVSQLFSSPPPHLSVLAGASSPGEWLLNLLVSSESPYPFRSGHMPTLADLCCVVGHGLLIAHTGICKPNTS